MPKAKATKEQLEYDFTVLQLTPQQVAEKYGYKPRSIWRAMKYRSLSHPHIAVGYKTLSNLQKQIVVGSLMGDGHLMKNGFHWSFRIGHCLAQFQLLSWKKKILGEWVTPRGIDTEVKLGRHIFNSFTTYTHSEFDVFQPLFYPVPPKKVISLLTLDQIEPLGLAVWFMDNGSHLTKKRGVRIHTCGFSFEENFVIRDWFLSRWNIVVHVGKISGGYPVITIYGDEADKFISIIKPHILPCMEYKILDR